MAASVLHCIYLLALPGACAPDTFMRLFIRNFLQSRSIKTFLYWCFLLKKHHHWHHHFSIVFASHVKAISCERCFFFVFNFFQALCCGCRTPIVIPTLGITVAVTQPKRDVLRFTWFLPFEFRLLVFFFFCLSLNRRRVLQSYKTDTHLDMSQGLSWTYSAVWRY